MDAKTTAKAERIANQARKAISSFCHEECRAYCCRKGYLVLSPSEYKLVSGKSNHNMVDAGEVTAMDGKQFSLFLGSSKFSCPCLSDFKCSIHDKKGRPSTCRRFPVFVDKDKVRLSARCLAVKHGMFFPYVKKFKALGFSILEGDQYYDSDFYNTVEYKNKEIKN